MTAASLPRRSFNVSAIILAMLSMLLAAGSARAADRWFTTSDGVKLHYTEEAPNPAAPTLLLVPGWTMPGWIFQPQIAHFRRHFRVIALDPRGQGESEIPAKGYDHTRRAQDISELITHLKAARLVLAGWSLGVLDTLAYLHSHGDAAIDGLVLIDNSIGENPPPKPSHPRKRDGEVPPPREVMMRGFVASMFRHKPPAPYLDRLTEASLRTPEEAAKLLLAYPVPRTFWREAVYSTRKPVLYAVRPTFAGQAGNFAANAANGQVAIFEKAGHALFVDEPERFNRTVEDFLGRKVWPGLVPAAAAAPPPMVSAPPVKAKPSSASDAGRPAR